MAKGDRHNEVKRSIRSKLLIFLALGLFTMMVIGLVGYYGISQVYKNADDIGNHWLAATNKLNNVILDIEDSRRYLLAGFIARNNPVDFNNYKDNYFKTQEKQKNDLAEYQNLVTSARGQELLQQLMQTAETYDQDVQKAWSLLAIPGQEEEARRQILVVSKAGFDKVYEVVQNLFAYQSQGSNSAVTNASRTHNQLVIAVLVVCLIALFFGGGSSVWFAQHISKPMVEVTGVMSLIAEGDLTVKLPEVRNRDEAGVLVQAVGRMLNSFRELISKVMEQAAEVAAASEEIQAGTQEAAAGSQVQAKDTQEITVKISEMAAAAEEMAANAENAADTAEKTLRNAEQGQDVVKAALAGMQGLQHSVRELGTRSEQIGQIVEIIDDIAEQTNLLALNAAIEAARAGEHGRGFAVVADEIRKLAERSGKATKEIAKLIGEIKAETNKAVDASEKTAGASDQAGRVFMEIVNLVRDSVTMVGQISTAATSVAELNTKSANDIQSVAAITEELAASSEEIAASATNLAQMSERLRQAALGFKL